MSSSQSMFLRLETTSWRILIPASSPKIPWIRSIKSVLDAPTVAAACAHGPEDCALRRRRGDGAGGCGCADASVSWAEVQWGAFPSSFRSSAILPRPVTSSIQGSSKMAKSVMLYSQRVNNMLWLLSFPSGGTWVGHLHSSNFSFLIF